MRCLRHPQLARVVGDALADERTYAQVEDLMLLVRAVALVEQGRLLAKGGLWEMSACEVRLPNAPPAGRPAMKWGHRRG